VLEFIFFHQLPCNQFEDFLQSLRIPFESKTDFQESIGEPCFTISISEKYDAHTIEALENFYDEMMILNEELVSLEEGDAEQKSAGISVKLSNGSTVLADVDPGLIYKLSRALSPEEITHLVDAIVSAVENPDSRPLCKR
jgi:hypothetical protein